jgi:hypothetical protein
MGAKKVFIGSCYRPNGQSAAEVESFMSDFQESLDMVFHRNPTSIIIMGDFNDVCTVWESDHRGSELGLKLYDYINRNDLHQIVLEPTHISTDYANILDLLITDSPGYLQNHSLLPPIGSRHQIVGAEFSIQYKRDKIYSREIWSYKHADFEGLVADLQNTPWHVGFDLFEDIDEIADYWQKSFMEACRIKIPNKIIQVRPKDKPWMTNEVKMYIRRRNRMFKRFKRTKVLVHEEAWKMQQGSQIIICTKQKLRMLKKLKVSLPTYP